MGSFLGYTPEIVQKSPWRLDFEKYLQEQRAKPRPIVRAAQIKARQEQAARAPRGAGRKPRIPKTDRRPGVRKEKEGYLVERSKFCAVCNKGLNENNSSGHCKAHWNNMRRIAVFGVRPTCSHEGCEKRLYRDNKIGLCREHGDPIRKKAWEEANKEKVLAQKRAWSRANNHLRKLKRANMTSPHA